MFEKENNNTLALVIVIVASLFLLILVFKAGFMFGELKSKLSTCDFYKNDFSEHWHKKFDYIKKSAYSNYKGVSELTETGFVAIDGYGKEQVVVITEDTKIIKGKETAEAEVSVGDKVYVDGETDESGQVVAELIKIYDPALKEYKK